MKVEDWELGWSLPSKFGWGAGARLSGDLAIQELDKPSGPSRETGLTSQRRHSLSQSRVTELFRIHSGHSWTTINSGNQSEAHPTHCLLGTQTRLQS